MFEDDSDDGGDISATVVLSVSKLLAANDDIYTSTEYAWLMDMPVNYTLQVIMSPSANIFLETQTSFQTLRP